MKLRAHALLVTALLFVALAGCKKDAPEAEAESPSAAAPAASVPADVLAYVSLPDGMELSELKSFVTVLSPEAAGQLSQASAMMGPMLASQIGGVDVDLKKPMHLVVLNPKSYPQPVVVVGTVTGKAGEGFEIRKGGDWQLAGATKALDAVAAFGGALPAPKRMSIVAYPGNAVAAYRQEIESLPAMMNALAGAGGQDMGFMKALMDSYARGAIAFGEATDSIEILLETSEGRATALSLVHAKKGTLLDKTIRAQSPASFKLVESVPPAKLTYFESNIVAGPSKEPMLKFFGEIMSAMTNISGDKMAVYDASMKAMGDLITGEMAGTMDMSGMMSGAPKTTGVWRARTTGKGDVAKTVNDMFSAWSSGQEMKIGDIVQTTVFTPNVGEHSGVKYGKNASKMDMSKTGGGLVEQTAYVGVLGDEIIMTMGDEAAMKAAIDRIKKAEGSPLPGMAKQVFDMARKRKASAAMTMDFAAVIPQGIPMPKMPYVGMTVAFKGSTMEFAADLFTTK